MVPSNRNCISLILIISIETLTLSSFSVAQDKPEDFLAAHNKVRAADGVGPLKWSPTLALYASSYANELAAGGCNNIHHSDGPFGENLAYSEGDLSGVKAVELWADEKANYDYKSNTCAAGKICGHYTQVVWKDTLEVGCAKVKCPGGGTLISCNYDPTGNYEGERPF
ncbi:unnamed protein product [Linum tenue]|uniref:SCP domain-containing protein n=1 Tax=Linum tenue TaxID=586396 RepID=A0AAV0MRL5_9ROSI|nr:unnamed protein product [Linum tenue]CAI0448728.1 unnamed protein product [Linum tenue]